MKILLHNFIIHLVSKFKSSRAIRSYFMIIVVGWFTGTVNAQTTFSSTTTGQSTWTVPCGVTSITVEAWGGGGAGGGSSANNVKGGGGGAGGSYVSSVIAVSAGQSISYYVGAGTTGNTTAGLAGQGSWIVNNTTVFAQGGAGGAAPNGGTVTGGIGSIASSYGSTLTSGSSGGNGTSLIGGAGGNGSNPTGGSGGASISSGGNGNFGSSPGGGGGGAFINSNNNRTGGDGGDGQIKITYTPPYLSQFISASYGATNWCQGETRNVTVQIKNIGTATWTDTSPDINIGVKWNTNGTSWADYYVRVNAGNLAPGATGTYTLPITASNATPGYGTSLAVGTNNLTFDVVDELVSWFADNNNCVGPGNVKYTSPNINIVALPIDKVVAATTATICSGGSTTITVAAALATTSYQLRNNSDNSLIGLPVTGNGGTISLPTGILTTTTTFNVLATTGCSLQMSATPTVTVRQAFTSGTIVSTGEIICYNVNPSVIGSTTVASGGDNTITYKWQANGIDIASSNSATYDPPTALIATTTYTRFAKDNTCNTTFILSTGSWVVTVRPNFTPGTIVSTGESICYNGDPALIGSTTPASGGDNTITYKWQANGVDIASSNLANYDPPTGLTATTTYTRFAKDNTCNTTFTVSTGSWVVTVRPIFTSGTIVSTGETICYNGNPSVIGNTTVASGGDNIITYKWQANGIDIASSNSATYDPPTGLTATTTYIRFAKDNSCNTTFTQSTGSWVVAVRPAFTSGTIVSTGETICYNDDPGLIGSTTAASGGDNTITYKWQANGVDIVSSNTDTYDPPTSLIATTTYTRFAKDNTCNTTFTLSTGSWVVTVRPIFTSGTIVSTGETICYNGNPSIIGSTTVASGGDNTISYKWQANGVDIASSNSATYDPPTGLIATTTYTRFAKDNTCNTTFSQSTGSWVVAVRPAFTSGVINSTGETICYNGNPSLIGTTTVASGGDNTITYKWQANGVDIVSSNLATYDPPTGLIVTTTYTRFAKDNTCNTTFTVSTGSWIVTVRPNFTSGTIISTGETICYNGDPALIGSITAASGGDNSITYKWQANGLDIASSNTDTYDPPTSLKATTTYTRFAKDNTCNTTFTVSAGSWVVSVRPIFTSGTIVSTGETICYNGNPSVIGNTTVASGGDNTITYKWQANGVDIASSNSATYDPPTGLTTTTTYIRFAKDNSCNTTFTQSTGSWVVAVNPTPVGSATAQTICSGDQSNVSLNSTVSGTTFKWTVAILTVPTAGTITGQALCSSSCGTSIIQTLTNTGTTLGSIRYTVTPTANGCDGTPFTVTVSVNPKPIVNTISNVTYCNGVPGSAIPFSSTTTPSVSVSYIWSSTADVGFGLSGTGDITAFTALNTTNAAITATVTVSASINGCSGIPKTFQVTVNPTPTASIIANYCAVPGKIQLTAAGGGTYLWNTGQTMNPILVDVAGVYSVTVTLGGCSATTFLNVAQELVVNGNFTQGNTGFTSDYTYHPDVPVINNELFDDTGTNGYGVGTSGQNYHPLFWGIDHTNNATGSRNFMLVNGHGSTLTIWQQTVTVQPNTDYYFSAWAMSLNNIGPYAQLQFQVNGINVGTTAALGAGPASSAQASANNYWTRFYSNTLWNSGALSSVTIKIVDLQSALTGNDFGLDDISFGTLAAVPFFIAPAGNSGSNTTLCAGQTFNLYTNLTNGKAPITYSWTGPNGFTSNLANPSILNVTAANTGNYILTVTDGYGCGSQSGTIALAVTALPTCTISGTNNVCPSSTNTYSAPASMDTYSWSVSAGNATISGPSNGQMVSVVAPTTCEAYTLSLTIVNNGCSNTGLHTFNAVDTTSPVIICPANLALLSCNAIVPAVNLGLVTATDNCTVAGAITIVWVDDIVNVVGCTETTTRTFKATDACGNYSTGVQLITRTIDNISPVITCPANQTFCQITPNNYTIPIVITIDNCSGVMTTTFTIAGATIRNGSGNDASGLFNLGVSNITWTVTDACGNSSNCSIIVTINPTPSAPAIDSITQPNCITPTGTVVLSGLPSGTWTLTRSPGAITTSGSGTSTSISGLAAGSYTYIVTNASGCPSTSSNSVGIIAATTATWNGSTWTNGPPTINQALIFTGNYSSAGDLSACSCLVSSGTVVFNAPNTLTIENWVHVTGGSLTFKNDLNFQNSTSASLVQINNVNANSGIITYERMTNYNVLNTDYTYWSSPVIPQTLYNLSPNTLAGMTFSYDPAIDNWKRESSGITMDIGKGYIVRGPESLLPPTPYFAKFIGAPNNGQYTIPSIIADRSYLLGNPYPSAIDADIFLTENANVLDGTLYFWTHNTPIAIGTPDPGTGLWAYSGNDYAAYNGVGGVGTIKSTSGNTLNNASIPIGKIAAGQGFFASSLPAPSGNAIVYNNDIRVAGASGNNSQFFKTTNTKTKTVSSIEKNRIWLDLSNSQGAFKQTLIGYITDATNDYDDRFDGESYDGNEFVDFYSVLKDKNLTIQGRALPFDKNDLVPLGFRSTINGDFTINIDQVDGLLTNQSVFIEDKLTNTITDLKSGNYTFSTLAGTFNDRFILKYANNALGLEKDKVDGIMVLYSNNYKTLIIRNNTLDSTVNTVTLFNMTGQKISDWEVKNYEQTNIQIPIKHISSGIYIVKIKTTKGESSKKIIVN